MIKKAGNRSSSIARAIAESKRRAAAAKRKSAKKPAQNTRSDFKKADTKPSLQRFRGEKPTTRAPTTTSGTGDATRSRPTLRSGLSNAAGAASDSAAQVTPSTLRRAEALYADPDFEMQTHSDLRDPGEAATDALRRNALQRDDDLRNVGQRNPPVDGGESSALHHALGGGQTNATVPDALADDIAAAETAQAQARDAHNTVRTAPPPRSDAQATHHQTLRDDAQDATRDAVIAQQTANATAEQLGEPAPYPDAADLPDATTQTSAEANDAVSRSPNTFRILGGPAGVKAPEQEAADRAREVTNASGSAQTAVLQAEQELDALGSSAPHSQADAARQKLSDANTTAADAGQRAVAAQRDANAIAQREDQPLPFPDADHIPENIAADATQLSQYVAAQPQALQRKLIGAHQQIDAADTASPDVAIAQAQQAQDELAATNPTLGTNSPERAAAEQATQTAVQAQLEANATARDAGDALPYPAAEDIPQHFIDNPAQLSEHLARQSPETQRALVGTDIALTEQVFQQDVRDAQNAAAQGGADGADGIANVAQRYAGNPERVDALIDELGPELDSITDGITTKDYGRDEAQATVEGLGRVAELATEDGARDIARGIIQNENLSGENPDLYYLDDGINKAENGSGIALGTALASELDAAGHTGAASDVRSDVVDNLNDLTSDVRAAGDAREDADAQLRTDLRDFSFLSEEEVADYSGLYHQENAAVYEGEANAAARLDEVLGRSGPELNELATEDSSVNQFTGETHYPHSEDVVNAHRDLADTSLPGRALEWATAETSPEVQAAFGAHTEKIFDEVVEPATAGALLQFQAEAGGDSQSALDRFEDAFGRAKLGNSVIKNIDDIRGAGTLGEIAESARDYSAVLRGIGTPEGRAQYDQLIRNKANQGRPFGGPLDGAFAAGSFAFSVANLGGNESALQDVIEGVSVVNGGVDLLARGIDTVNASNRLGFIADTGAGRAAAKFSRFAGRTVPYVNIALNAAATTQSVQAALKDPSGGAILQAFGDGLSLAGSIAGAFPPAKPFAAIAEFAGLGLSTLGAYWAGAEGRNQIDDEQQSRLSEVLTPRHPDLVAELGQEGFDEAIRQTADASNPRADEVATAGNLNTEQVLRLFGTVPPSNNSGMNALLFQAENLGLRGDEFVNAAQSLHRASGGQDGLLGHHTLEALHRAGIQGPDVARALDQLHAANGGGQDGAIALFELQDRLEAVEGFYIPPGTPADYRPQFEANHASDINRHYAGLLADAGLNLDDFGIDIDSL